MISSIAKDVCSLPEQESTYQQMWSLYLWGLSADDIAESLIAQGADVTRFEVRAALAAMKQRLDDMPYPEMAETETRLYLARNVQMEQELVELFINAKNDYALMRSGQVTHADGSRAMPVDVKMLQGLLTSIEKQGQSRASALLKLAQGTSSAAANAPALPQASASIMQDIMRSPEEEFEDAEFTHVE